MGWFSEVGKIRIFCDDDDVGIFFSIFSDIFDLWVRSRGPGKKRYF